MIRVCFLGVSAALLALILQREKGEFAIVLALMAGMLIFAFALSQVTAVMEFVEEIMEKLPFENEYLRILFRMLGITCVAEFADIICRDAGYQSIAGQIEIFAKLAVVVLSLPCLSYLVRVVEEFL